MPDKSVTIDDICKAMQHWRANKLSYTDRGVPDKIWRSIFQLEGQGYSVSQLRQMFGLNSAQYKRKHDQLCSKVVSQHQVAAHQVKQKASQNAAIQFSEVVIADKSTIPPLPSAPRQTKQAIKKIKSNVQKPESYLDMTTVIVECIRPDGHRLKIHTTQTHLAILMQSFYNQEVISI